MPCATALPQDRAVKDRPATPSGHLDDVNTNLGVNVVGSQLAHETAAEGVEGDSV